MTQFFIRLTSNRSLVFNTSFFQKVADIKSELYQRQGIPINLQTLILNSKVLNDNDILANVIGSEEKTIHLHFQTLGGVKGGNHRGRQSGSNSKRELVYKVPSESDYGFIKTMSGDKRAIVLCLSDGKEYQCRIAGSLHQWIKREDIVLIGLRDFEPGKGDIIWRYTPEEARKLIKAGEIQHNIKINEDKFSGRSSNIDFVDNQGNYKDDDEDELTQQRNYDMPPSESESEEEVDLEKI